MDQHRDYIESEHYTAPPGSPLSLYTTQVKRMERELIGREKELRQVQAGLARPEYSNIVLLGEAGSGKGHPLDFPIPVADFRGMVPAGSLEPGDYLIDENGQPVELLKTFYQGKKHCYAVYFSDGSVVVCNDEHLWTVRNENFHLSDGPYETITLREIMDRGGRFWIPAGTPVEQIPPKDPVRSEYPSESANIYGIGQMIVKGYYDDIPYRYLYCSRAQRLALLQGIVSSLYRLSQGDHGCVLRLHPVRPGILHSVHQLCASLGYRTHITDYQHTGQDTILFFDQGERLLDLFPEGSAGKEGVSYFISEAPRKWEPYTDLMITKIEDLQEEREMVCLYVNSDTHLYRAGRGYIVTHNTALVQGLAKSDPEKLYLEVDLAKMIADLNDPNEMAARLKDLFSDVAALHEKEGKVVVLFMDEFHQVVQLSAAAVEALKPLLADSGTRGIRVIAATTLKEFNQYIMPNQPLVERLQRVTLSEPGRKATISILKDFAKKYGVADQIVGDSIYDSIYENTNRYIPANAQPRKSILLLDAMIGYHNVTNRPFDKKLLADVIYESEGINVDFRVDAVKIRENLDAAVYAQRFATSTVSDALQIAVAQIEERSRPMCSLLFTGPSGCGKAITVDTEVWVTDAWMGHKEKLCAGNVQVGDYLFTRHHEQTRVLGVFPQGRKRVWKVTFSNGSTVGCSENHLWGCKYDCMDDYFHVHDTRWLSSYIESGNTVYVPVLDVEKESYTRIISIEETLEKEEMVCFYVDDEEHMFSLGNDIVTHNTELTKQLASILFGQDRTNGDENQSGNRNLIRLDMTEFSRPESVERFRAELTSRVWERPFSVILLDEIEKACAEVTRMLLPVLDDGRMTDVHGRQVVFTNAYIVMTTNAASEIYETLRNYGISEDDDESIKSLMKYMPLIRRSISSTTGSNKFPPELLGRFDAIVPFQPLSDRTKEKIAESKLRKLSRDVYRKHGAKLTYKKDIINYLVKDAMDPGSDSGGARMVVSKIREEVMTPVAAFLNANPKVRDIAVTVVGDMAHENKHMLESNAHIKVSKLGS